MAGFLDFLGALGGVAAPVVRGYLGGQVQAQHYQQQRQAGQADTTFKQQQIDLQKQKLKFDQDQAARKPLDDAKAAFLKHVGELELKFETDPQAQGVLQTRGPQAVQQFRDFVARARAVASNPDAKFEDLQKLYAESPSLQHVYLTGQQQAQAQPQFAPAAASPSTPTTMRPNVQSPINQMVGAPNFFPPQPNQDRSLPQHFDLAQSLVSQQNTPGTPTAQPAGPPLNALGYPETPAETEARLKREQQAKVDESTIRRNNAMAGKAEVETDFAAPKAMAQVQKDLALAGQAQANTTAIPQRVKLAQDSLKQSALEADRMYKLNRDNAQAKQQLDERMYQLQTFMAMSADYLRQAQTSFMNEQVAKMRQDMEQQAKQNPMLKTFIDAFEAMTVHTQFGDYIPPSSAAMLASMFDQAGGTYGDIIRKYAAQAPQNFMQAIQGNNLSPQDVAGMLQGGAPPGLTNGGAVPGAEAVAPAGIPEGTVRDFQGTNYLYQKGNWVPMPPGMLAPVPRDWTPPPNPYAGAFQSNRDNFLKGNYAPGRKATTPKTKPKNASEKKTAAAEKKQPGYVSRNPDKPKYMLAPKAAPKKIEEMTVEQKQKRIAELERKARGK